jgi:hypothetical protein
MDETAERHRVAVLGNTELITRRSVIVGESMEDVVVDTSLTS